MAHGNIFNTWPVSMGNLHSPNMDTLVHVLEDRLKQNFLHVNVRSVDCPDLTQEPFNLAAPGLCGQAAFIEIGDKTFLEPIPAINREQFLFSDIIRFLNRDNRNSFIFGNGVSASRGYLDQLIVNASFSPTTNGLLQIENKSHDICETCSAQMLFQKVK
ncbi:unnamed protein product [Lasius platythorax]|uniref:DUF1907 domain-containing protein n=1 Tax=Lasius platythorax TaxID=488582 RepID=A0AAV2P1C3_9HYME